MTVDPGLHARIERTDDVGTFGIDAPNSAGPVTFIGVGICAVGVIILTIIAIAFADIQRVEIEGAVWAFLAAGFVAKGATFLLLVRHALAFPSRSVAMLAVAYLVTTMLNLPFQLSLPIGAVRHLWLVGTLQASLWLFFAASVLFSAIVIASSLMRPKPHESNSDTRRWVGAYCVAGVLATAALGVLVGIFADSLPKLINTGSSVPTLSTNWFYGCCAVSFAVTVAAMAATMPRALAGSRLRVWLEIALLLNLSGILVLIFAQEQWTLGWYAATILGLAGSCVLAFVLVAEVIAQSGQLARALHERDELAAIITAAADGIVVVNGAGTIVWANAHAEKLFRTPELVGAQVATYLPSDARDALFREPLLPADAADPRTAGSREVDVIRADGTRFTADIAVRPLTTRDGTVSALAIRDATDRLEYEYQLAEARERLLDTTAQLPIGHAACALNGTIVEVNDAFCQITGYTRDYLIGTTYQSITHPDDMVGELREIAALADGIIEGYTLEKRYVRGDGSTAWIEMHVSATRDRNSVMTGFTSQVIDVNARKLAEQQAATALADLSYRSTHDPLTGVLNHRELLSRLDKALHSEEFGPYPTAVLFCDLDRFKDINDGLGHVPGDDVLAEVGKRFRSRVRDTDLVGRVGGDEFVVALHSVQNLETAVIAAQNIRAAISDVPFEVAGRTIQLTLSVGVALAPKESEADAVIAQADDALYRAKANGRNRLEIYDLTMELAAARRLQLGNEMREAIKNDEFHAWFQPIVDLRTQELVGYEALARWLPDGDEVKAADDFIAVAEETGSIVAIGAAVISEAITYLSLLPKHLTMAINVSPVQISTGTFGTDLLALIDAAGVNPNRVIIEITEHAILRLNPADRSQLERLWSRGIRLDIDDFGTGYSALAHIRELPVTGLKLDKSFTSDLQTMDSAAFRLAQGVGLLAASLRLTDVAEGVETAQQAKLLRHAGWTRGQGYLFGKAAPPPDVVRLAIPDQRPHTPVPASAVPAPAPEQFPQGFPRGRRHTD